ncbi:MAG: DUF3048 domain-containing protein [Chloroflexota bacterium]|nr:DUF3048 domain-containing protein [Chloroflexota bacterium]
MMKFTQMMIVKSILVLTAIALVGCTQADPPDLTMAGTYAAQTQAAISGEITDPKSVSTDFSGKTPVPTEMESTAAPTPTNAPVGPFNFPENINPLTGMYMADPTILDRRPVLVKVANYPANGRPHAGLSFADMVFEYYIGAGANRFVGLFYGQDTDEIGPMRSGRLVDPQIVSLYEGILGMVSAYVTVFDHIDEILGNRVISGRSTCPAICDDGRNIVISVFANSEQMTKYAEEHGVDQKRYTLEGMAFDPQAPTGGSDGPQATILFGSLNRGEWRFDEDSGKYLRWIEDLSGQNLEMIPLVDRETDEQLAFSNVVVIFANHTELAPTLHEIDLWNAVGQHAVYFRDGQVYEGTWATPSKNQPIQFFDQIGRVFPLKPGNTWVVIMGTSSVVTEDSGSWIFDSRLP